MEGFIQRLQGMEKYGKRFVRPYAPSMENLPPVLVDVDVAQAHPEKAGQAVVDPISLNEYFNPPVSSTPEREGRNTSSAETHCKKLQKDKCKTKKQVLHLRKQLAEMRKLKDKFRKSEKTLMARQREGLSEKFKLRGCKKLSAERNKMLTIFCPEMKTVVF